MFQVLTLVKLLSTYLTVTTELSVRLESSQCLYLGTLTGVTSPHICPIWSNMSQLPPDC